MGKHIDEKDMIVLKTGKSTIGNARYDVVQCKKGITHVSMKRNIIILVTHENEIAEYSRRIVRLRDRVIELDEKVENPVLAAQ